MLNDEVGWTSYGHWTEVRWTSYGHRMDVVWTSDGSQMDVEQKPDGCRMEVGHKWDGNWMKVGHTSIAIVANCSSRQYNRCSIVDCPRALQRWRVEEFKFKKKLYCLMLHLALQFSRVFKASSASSCVVSLHERERIYDKLLRWCLCLYLSQILQIILQQKKTSVSRFSRT
jgi:hypothetical protein